MLNVIEKIRSLSKEERLGVILLGAVCYCFGLVPLAFLSPLLVRLVA
jgi:hypothetical protein